jgi:hypothetical protein
MDSGGQSAVKLVMERHEGEKVGEGGPANLSQSAAIWRRGLANCGGGPGRVSRGEGKQKAGRVF